jgi:hypothetical protein
MNADRSRHFDESIRRAGVMRRTVDVGFGNNPHDDFISYEHQATIGRLNNQLQLYQQMNEAPGARLAIGKDFGPCTLRIAMGLQRTAIRYPRLASAVKRIARLGA